MEASQYRLNDGVWYAESNQLLDDDGMPSESLPNRQAKSLAAIASAIHLNVDSLRESQLEQVVAWLKRLKISKKYPPGSYLEKPHDQFYLVLREIRESKEQVVLQKKANVKAIKSNICAALLSISISATIILPLIDVSKWISAIPALISFLLFSFMQAYTVESFDIAKEQDRRYLLNCLRRAETVDELSEAGLLGYIKEMQLDERYDREEALAAAKKEVERLRDALYTRSRLLED